MSIVTASAFASALGISDRAARMAFAVAKSGKTWKGEILPVVQVPGQRGGKGGSVWALHLDGCSPKLRAVLGLPESTEF